MRLPVSPEQPTATPARPGADAVLRRAGELRAVFCDLDGTLLDAGHLMPDGALEAIARLQESGVRFVPTTGRTVFAMRGLFGEALERLGMDYVACNGMDVACGGATLLHAACPREGVEALLRFVAEGPTPLGAVVYGPDEPYVLEREARFVRAEIESLHDARVAAWTGQVAGEVSKLGIVTHGGAAGLAELLKEKFGEFFEFSACGQEWVDVAAHGHTKLEGIGLVMEAYGLAPHEVLAVGDSMNDMTMLRALPQSVCVANAMPQVKAVCAYEIGSNADLAVPRLLAGIAETRAAGRDGR